MKKIKIKLSKSQKFKKLCFFRFLKENGVFYDFFNQIRVKDPNMFFKIQRMLGYGFIAYALSNTYFDREKWRNIDLLWHVFIYEHQLYGLTYTCSKKDLLHNIKHYSQSFTNDIKKDVLEKLKSIIEREEENKKIKNKGVID